MARSSVGLLLLTLLGLTACAQFHTATPPAGRAPDLYRVELSTTKGPLLLEVHRPWAPHAADRFHELVRTGYYDNSKFFRISRNWAQFGIAADPAIARAWRNRPIPDDPVPLPQISNTRGTVAFAFAAPNARTAQVFINLRDNAATHDAPADGMPFIPFARVVSGMEAADALNAEYGETSGGGIRGGKQDPLFEHGNAYLDAHFPRLDTLLRARIRP